MTKQISIKNKPFFRCKNIVFTNSLILILASLIIKVISLINRIYLTRYLGDYGIAIYTLILPTIMLFISIGGFSLNNTITKIVSENNEYSDYEILKISRIISLFTSAITIIIFLISIKFIAIYALKQPNTIRPLLYTIFFIPLTALNNVYRGYSSGKNKIKQTAISTVIEQISRFFITIILLYLFSGLGSFASVSLTIIAMCFGELISLLYILFKTKKVPKIISNNDIKKLIKRIFNLSLSTTLTHLISNLALFLEPIIFTLTLSNKISSNEILLKYSEINSFVIPTLTLLSFISFQYSQAIFPILSKNYSNNKNQELASLVNKSIYFMIIISTFIAYIFFFYSEEIFIFLYDTITGVSITKKLSFIFILSYITPIFTVLLQATNNYGYIFKCSIFCTLVKIFIIFVLGYLPINTELILPISLIIYIILSFILFFIKTLKIIKFKLPLNKILFMILCCYHIFILSQYIEIHFIIKIFICFISYLLFFLFL